VHTSAPTSIYYCINYIVRTYNYITLILKAAQTMQIVLYLPALSRAMLLFSSMDYGRTVELRPNTKHAMIHSYSNMARVGGSRLLTPSSHQRYCNAQCQL
jgi:hypothetical protein